MKWLLCLRIFLGCLCVSCLLPERCRKSGGGGEVSCPQARCVFLPKRSFGKPDLELPRVGPGLLLRHLGARKRGGGLQSSRPSGEAEPVRVRVDWPGASCPLLATRGPCAALWEPGGSIRACQAQTHAFPSPSLSFPFRVRLEILRIKNPNPAVPKNTSPRILSPSPVSDSPTIPLRLGFSKRFCGKGFLVVETTVTAA